MNGHDYAQLVSLTATYMLLCADPNVLLLACYALQERVAFELVMLPFRLHSYYLRKLVKPNPLPQTALLVPFLVFSGRAVLSFRRIYIIFRFVCKYLTVSCWYLLVLLKRRMHLKQKASSFYSYDLQTTVLFCCYLYNIDI